MPYPTETSPLSAQELVNEAWDFYRELGNSWLEQASTTIADLTSIQVTPLSFSVDYNVDSFLPTFVRPTAPDRPVFGTIVANTPPAPTLDEVTIRALGAAPVQPNLDAYLNYAPPAPPTDPMPRAPGDVTPALDAITIEARPDYTLPVLPSLYDLDLPVVPVITLPEFDGIRPTFDLTAPTDGDLPWEEVLYTSELKDELTAKIRDMMQGSLGLPAAIEAAIFDRGRAREDLTSHKLVNEISQDMASRDLTEPNGIFGKRLEQAREANRSAVGSLNEQITIESAKLSIENVKFAVGQGMALEQVLIQMNQSINERALRAALATRDYGIARYNALINYCNLQQTAYATDAQVWRDRIAGELSKLELFKAEIDGQRLVGEINKDLIAQYVAQFEGVKALAEFYKTDVEAAKVRGEINLQRLQGAELILKRFSTEVEAWGKLQDGYKTQVEAALGTTKFAETLASIFNTRMNGFKTEGEAYFQEGRFQLERNAQTLDLFKANLAGADMDLRGQLAELDGQLRSFGAEVQLYEAGGNIAQAESASYDRTTNLKVEMERNRTSVALESAKMRIDQALKIGEILVEQIKAKAAALAQLAAASQSGVNFGAQLSGSLSTSYSFSRGQSWTGETPDHDASGVGQF